jgi:thiamine biosynthesis lipoprotein
MNSPRFTPPLPLQWPTKLLLLCGLLISLSGCEQKQPVYQQQLLALGTLIDITIYGSDDKTAQAAIQEVTQQMEGLHHNWHAWQPGKLTEINRKLAAGETASLDAEGVFLINRGMQLSQLSNNLFNPAVGKLIGLWGFHSDDWSGRQPPAAADIAALLAAKPQMSDLVLEANQLRSNNPAVELDLGAYAKGYAVDVAIATLRKHGINNAIVNAGGNLRLIGSKGKQPWRIGIRDPRGTGVIASLEAGNDEAVITSGDYERYFEYQGQRYHHIIDPRNGYPARGAIATTIIAADGLTADVASTALLIAGPDHWRETARVLGIEEAMLIDDKGVVHITRALMQRIHFEKEPAPQIQVVD